ncbi:hypothetical protein BDF14DRAFT_1883891 [Spinellus fusiger]|nr:hypothetical protein BDF14DRAFT_1883891 [Spinellus fusiger]
MKFSKTEDTFSWIEETLSIYFQRLSLNNEDSEKEESLESSEDNLVQTNLQNTVENTMENHSEKCMREKEQSNEYITTENEDENEDEYALPLIITDTASSDTSIVDSIDVSSIEGPLVSLLQDLHSSSNSIALSVDSKTEEFIYNNTISSMFDPLFISSSTACVEEASFDFVYSPSQSKVSSEYPGGVDDLDRIDRVYSIPVDLRVRQPPSGSAKGFSAGRPHPKQRGTIPVYKAL